MWKLENYSHINEQKFKYYLAFFDQEYMATSIAADLLVSADATTSMAKKIN